MIKGVYKYIAKSFEGAKPFLGFVLSGVTYIIFPDDVHKWALMAVLLASLMDILTKSYSKCKNNGGFVNAIKVKALFSKQLWKGTEVKIVSYLSIAILTGLSYRVMYLDEMGVILASFVYSVMFMREFQSNIENLIEAGANLDWLLLFSKKKNKELMQPYEEEVKKDVIKEEVNNYEERI